VIDALTPEQVEQLSGIAGAILQRLDPDGTLRPRADSAASSGPAA
jgi:hypothetical protein